MDFLETGWQQPDEGIWEVRGPRRHFVHSKVMAWVAVDRAIKGVTDHGLSRSVDEDGGRCARQDQGRMSWPMGYDADRNTFTQYYGSKGTRRGPAQHPHGGFPAWRRPASKQGTVAAIEKDLLSGRLRTPLHDDGKRRWPATG